MTSTLNKNSLKVRPGIGDRFNHFCHIHLWSSTWGLFMQTIRKFAYIQAVKTKNFISDFSSYLSTYPASSWFLLRQTREKPLRATVCFSIEHARARHTPRDAFDAKVHLSIIFSLEVFRYKRIKMYLTQSANKKIDSILTVFLLSFYENDSLKKCYFFTTSMFADR